MLTDEDIQLELTELQSNILKRMQTLRQLTKHEDKWLVEQINSKKYPSNGELIYPRFDRKCCYYQEFWKVYLLNQILIAKVKDFTQVNKQLHVDIEEVEEMQKEWSRVWGLKTKKKVRRTSDMIEKNYICPFEKCGKNYGSDVALNMHMKLKHGSGTKTEREMMAKEICLAEERGEKVRVDLVFPPGYLEEFRQNFKREARQ